MPDDHDNAKAQLPGWHYVPDVPVRVSPFFSWPPDPARMAGYFIKNWLGIAENTILMLLALICWTWLSPSLETTATLQFDWIAGLWLRNLVLMMIVAGGLHWFFYMRKGQGRQLKFDGRDLMTRGKQFTFGGQVLDNMFWTLASGVGFWTTYEVLMLWAMGNGWIPVLVARENPVWFVLIFLLSPLWISFHFYWIHRALHWGPLYRIAHALHHRNVNVGPWSGLSMHPVESCGFFSSVLIHLIIPAHPLHIIFHLQHQALTAATSHTGFEELLVKDKRQLTLGRFHHQMHHRYFEVNYGNLEVPWDKWFGSFHDGTPEAHERLKERRQRRS